jgi:hypothetical protein
VRGAAILIISMLGLAGCVWFMIYYHVRSGGQWRRNEVGIWLMISRLNLGLIFALLIIGRVFGNPPWREILVIVLVCLFSLQTFWPIKFLWSPHIHGIVPREERREESPAHDPGT